MRVNAYLTITGILFGLISVGHVMRLMNVWPATIGEWQVPIEFSVSCAVIVGGLAVWSVLLLRGRS